MALPEVAEPHWRGAAEGRLMLPHCLSCNHVWYPPVRHCPRCLSAEVEWRAASGQGTVIGWCVFHRTYLPEADLPVPYTVVQVRLEEGPCLYANPADVQAVLSVGTAVEAVFVDVGDGHGIVRFKPAGTSRLEE